jgi:hypothetical protein
MTDTKPWYTSKTVWVGVAQIAVGAATAAGVINLDEAQSATDAIPALIPSLVTAGLGVATIATRVVAEKKLG